MKIILAGGGTGGPVMPLLAVAQQLKKANLNVEFLFIGTKTGPEQKIVENLGLKFVSIPSGKFRRYFSVQNIWDVFHIISGFFQSKKIIKDFKPDLIFSAGGFVAVPVCFAAKLAKVKIIIHQQDVRVSLSNKLVAPFADFITTTFEQSAKEFYTGSGFEEKQQIKAEWVGNPVRDEFFTKDTSGKEFFALSSEYPVLFITGGGSGATQINDVVEVALPELVKAHQVIHLTGPGKNKTNFNHPNYHSYDFLDAGYVIAMKIADIVVSRAGLSTIAELSALGKVSVIVPMPDSHQEDNAALLKQKNAAVVLYKDEFNAETLAKIIVSLKFNQKRCESLSENIKHVMPHDSATRIAKIISERYASK